MLWKSITTIALRESRNDILTRLQFKLLLGKPATIKKILEKHQIKLDDHNIKHELNPYSNRKAWIKTDEAINLI